MSQVAGSSAPLFSPYLPCQRAETDWSATPHYSACRLEPLGGNKPLSANKGSKAKGDTLRSVMPLSNRQSALSCSRLGLSFRVDLPDIVTSANFGSSRVGFLDSFLVEMAKNVRPRLRELATQTHLWTFLASSTQNKPRK